MSRSVLGKQWRVHDAAPGVPLSKGELLVRLLRLRGVASREEARRFLRPALPEPDESLPNLPAALDRLVRAVQDGERIAVYGDYDADGITATAVLVEGISDLGGVAFPYIPDRAGEGYGLNERALHALIERGAQLVVTVDTGTSAVREVAYANERGLDVIVLDHHVPKAELPDAVAIVNPHLGETPAAHADLSGCGVAYIVLLALADRLGGSLAPERYHDLVAISTVCDVVPLRGANRALVAAGLRELTAGRRPGLAALLEAARLNPRRLTTHAIGFIIGPRLNAAGRLDHGLKAYELLTTRDETRARALAAELETLNRRRQQLTDEAVVLSRALADAECAGAPLVMVGHPGISQGIAGLVAARLAEERYRPAIVYERGEAYSTGSARSVPGFDIHAALTQGAHLFERFGGHQQAGGFKVRTDRLDELRRVLTAWVEAQQDWSALAPALDIDLELPVDAMLAPGELLGVVRQIEPCGQANAAPLFLARDVAVSRADLTREGRHLRLRLRGGDRREWPAIAFGLGEHLPRRGARLDVVYAVTPDRDGGVQLQVKDFAVAE